MSLFGKKTKYIARIAIKKQGVYTIQTNRRVNLSNGSVKYKKRMYKVRIDEPTYQKGLKLFYVVDIHKKPDVAHINFAEFESKVKIDSETLDLVVGRGLITQLSTNLTGSGFKMNLYNLIIGGLMGGALVYIIMGFI